MEKFVSGEYNIRSKFFLVNFSKKSNALLSFVYLIRFVDCMTRYRLTILKVVYGHKDLK